MCELEYLYCKNLHRRLKECIRGKVFTKIENDELRIRIDAFDYWFEMNISDISNKIILGYGTDKMCKDILEKYRKYISNRMEEKYFKQEAQS